MSPAQVLVHGSQPRRRQPVGLEMRRAQQAAPGRGPGGRGGFNFSAFEHVLVDELIPFIDANYRTIADQKHRAMAGLSMGGLQTHNITLAHLDTFSHIGIFSGGSIAPNEITDMPDFKEKVKVVFISYGSREIEPAHAEAEAAVDLAVIPRQTPKDSKKLASIAIFMCRRKPRTNGSLGGAACTNLRRFCLTISGLRL